MTNWLVTGGCGFIGLALLKRLLEQGRTNVRIVDNLSVGTREDLAAVSTFSELDPGSPGQWSGVGLIEGDIQDAELAVRASAGAHVVVHLAANTGVPVSVVEPRKDLMANVLGTFNYLEAARQAACRAFVLASSGATVGACVPPVHEELPQHPISPYGASKLAGEAYCSAYHASYDLNTVCLRFGNVYGPGSGHKSSVVAAFLKCVFAGEPIIIHGDGTQTRDFIYIDDIVGAITASALTADVGGEVFQIATNREHSVLELAQMLTEVLKARGIKEVGIEFKRPRSGDVPRNFSDTSKAARRLGWRPQYELRDGLAVTVDWFSARFAANGPN